MKPLRDVSNTRFRQMVHYCEPCNYSLISLGNPSVLFGLGYKTASPITITPSHATKARKKRDLRSLDFHASHLS